jgi:hypothetical protein
MSVGSVCLDTTELNVSLAWNLTDPNVFAYVCRVGPILIGTMDDEPSQHTTL